jgi:hypothetical protein
MFKRRLLAQSRHSDHAAPNPDGLINVHMHLFPDIRWFDRITVSELAMAMEMIDDPQRQTIDDTPC